MLESEGSRYRFHRERWSPAQNQDSEKFALGENLALEGQTREQVSVS
jgi:hypothetical protein